MYISILILSVINLVATLLPLSRRSHWFFRGMDFPRLQLAIFSAFLLALQLWFLGTETGLTKVLILITSSCLAWQLWWILPYTVLWSKEVKTSVNPELDQQLSILTSNVLTPNRNVEALIKHVEQYQPDVLVTLESDYWWQKQLEPIESTMPYTVKCPLDNLYGMHVYSKLPLEESHIDYLVEDNVPSIHVSIRLRNGEKVRAHFLHPAPPSPTENTKSDARDAELVMVAKSVKDSNQPIIITGDLNDVAWSTTTRLFRKISGLLDPRVGRGMFNTFHADYSMVRWPLDHLFHSHHFSLVSIQRLSSIGSDHFPLFTRLAFTQPLANRDQGLEEDDTTESMVETISKKKLVDKQIVPAPGEN